MLLQVLRSSPQLLRIVTKLPKAGITRWTEIATRPFGLVIVVQYRVREDAPADRAPAVLRGKHRFRVDRLHELVPRALVTVPMGRAEALAWNGWSVAAIA